MAAISQLFVPFYTIVDYRDNRHLGDSTIVKFTIAIYRDNRQYRASLVARLPDDVPAHKALNCRVNLSLGRPPSRQWYRRPGCPHNRWVDQIRNDNNLHLRTSGGVLSVVVISERHYGPCWLSDDNNNNNGI